MASRLRLSRAREKLALSLSALLVMVVVAAASIAYVLQLRAGVAERAASTTQNLATSLTQTFDGLFDMADVALLASADEIARHNRSGKPDAAAINRYLQQQAERIPHMAYLRATNANGDVIYGPGLPAATVNLSDREFFAQLAANPAAGLVVGKPLIGRIAAKPLMTLVRPVRDAQGRFAGVVYASVYVEELERMLGEIQMEPGGSLALRDRDLGLIVRKVFAGTNTIAMGSQQIAQPFRTALASNPASGTFVSDATSLDPVLRTYSYLRSKKYGYMVSVGTPLAAQLQVWQRQAGVVLVLVLLFGGALLALVYFVSRSRRQLEGLVANLSHSEAQHRALLGSLQTGVVVHAPDTRIVFSNESACRLLGLTQAQMAGKTAIDPTWCFVDEVGQPLPIERYPVNRVLAEGRAIDDMMLGVKVPGRNWLVWLQGSAFPEWDAKGDLQHVVVNFHDISKRREAEERWRFALQGAGDGVWDLEVESGVAVYSRRYNEMLGYAEGELAGLHSEWVQRVHPEDFERVQRETNQQLRNPQAGGTVATEYRLRCKDGSYKWILSRGMVVSRGMDGQPLRIVGTHTDISEKKEADAKIWQQANFDPLTRLPNRRLFYDRLDMRVRQAQRDGTALALLFIDLDRFKEVNDTLGHDVGDQLLVEAAQRITQVVRDYDTVARLGGDEFTVLLAGHHHSFDVGAIAQKIIDSLSRSFVLAEHESYVSASIGIALFPEDAGSVKELVKNADQAMYAAKAAGRKCFRFFTKGMQETAIARMGLVGDLRRALALQQFEVHYQPIVELASGRVRKAEALLRWLHPVRGQVPPSSFIPVAEDIGVIHDIGDWVFAQATAQVAVWQARYGADFQVSVNKSPLQFANPAGHGRWVEQLRSAGVAGSSIVVEITEGVLMDSNAAIAKSLLEFRDCGIQVAIDDFGTGYSSLSYLKKFDIDYLKIDQSFVKNLSPGSADYALCEAIIVMAHKLGLGVVAEGVETQAQADLLLQAGCDFAQGYLFSRPLSVAAFEAYLQGR